jgi:DNA-binding response OmpR family regulator
VQADEKLKTIPVFFLTGKDDISTKVAAFAMGAEDYIVKPFNALELRARVEAKIKRAASQVESHQILRKGDLQLDGATHRVYSLASGEPSLIRLTPREFKLLFYLAKNEDHVISRSSLLDAIWGDSVEVFDRTVDTHISAIRKKLDKLSGYIESVSGAGYRFSSAKKGETLQNRPKPEC